MFSRFDTKHACATQDRWTDGETYGIAVPYISATAYAVARKTLLYQPVSINAREH